MPCRGSMPNSGERAAADSHGDQYFRGAVPAQQLCRRTGRLCGQCAIHRTGTHRERPHAQRRGCAHEAEADQVDGVRLAILTGAWLALRPETIGGDGAALRDNSNFVGADDAEVMARVLIKTRVAADTVGATMMDRPE